MKQKNLTPQVIPLVLVVIVVATVGLTFLFPGVIPGFSNSTTPKITETEQNYRMGVNYIQKGYFSQAAELLWKPSKENYEDSSVLYAFAEAKMAAIGNNPAVAKDLVQHIPDTYAGELSGQVLAGKKEILGWSPPPPEAQAPKKQFQLKLISFRWGRETDRYVRGVGEVQNVSNEPLKNVEAVVSFYDANGVLIKTETALVQYDPVMPGQTTPFDVIGTYNPLMKTAIIDFAYLMGGQIPTDFGERGTR